MRARSSLKDDFDRWAQLSARMLRRPAIECARIVRDAGVESEWNAADAHWYGVLIDDVEAGRLERVGRFRELCRLELGARTAEGAIVSSPIDLLDVDPADPTPAFARRLMGPPKAAWAAVDQEGTGVGFRVAAPPAAPAQDPEPPAAREEWDRAPSTASHPATEGHDWTIEQYAWLRAELERYPERSERIWSLRGVDHESGRRAVIEIWEQRIARSHELRAKYDDLMARYRSMLA
jgi:hypothetical protein